MNKKVPFLLSITILIAWGALASWVVWIYRLAPMTESAGFNPAIFYSEKADGNTEE